MAKSRSITKKTSRSASRAATKAKPARASAAKPKVAKSAGSKNGTPVRLAAKAKPKVAKATSAKAARKGKSGQINVKVGSFGGRKPGSAGGGLGFLAGKPGSTGASGPLDQSQPRLTRTKLGARDLRHFRELLLAKRRQLVGDMETMENEALRSDTTNLSHLPVHMADMGTDNYEQEFTLSLVDRERKLVDEIDAALKKIDEKTYGICEGTGQMIARERLEAQPWARYSIEYARHLQRPGVRR